MNSKGLQTKNDVSERIYYLDNVRAIAMFLGIVLHASLPYGYTFYDTWFIKNDSQSITMDVIFTFIHLFRMALFFLISGFFANMLVQKRGVLGFTKNRGIRLLIPFIIFYPIVVTAMTEIIHYSGDHLHDLSKLVALITKGGFELPPRTMHLWFIYHLMAFCIIVILVCRADFSWISKISSKVFSSSTSLLYLPILIIPGLYYAGLPQRAPSSFYFEIWSLGYYGLFFLFGWHLFHHSDYLKRITKHIPLMSVFCLIGFIIFYLKMEPLSFEQLLQDLKIGTINFSWDYLIRIIIEAYLSFYLVMLSLLLGKQFLDSSHKVFRYLSDASYWVYIIHLPVVYFIQVLMGNWKINLWIEFIIAVSGTMIVSLITYQIAVRYTIIGTILNGKKTRSAQQHPGKLAEQN
ncbi:acyltransferase family protein [Spartinivicinus poritis]|uniref:Acyltransferase family protein n=1 Tax=Spartinivicinus poritis TaxID=2994640 RepID=A0ABT5UBQ7_9GAMM|nr:acyltransferase family protein [Spartinivicinus sp. A2-2]MDE1463807.1 acyltransferase family protein [Spartinivicinus sp. A2-2]